VDERKHEVDWPNYAAMKLFVCVRDWDECLLTVQSEDDEVTACDVDVSEKSPSTPNSQKSAKSRSWFLL